MDNRLDELLKQLKQLSPMPDGESITQEEMDAYNKVIDELEEVLEQNRDPIAIQPLIASFGYNDIYEIFQTPMNMLYKFNQEQVLPYLLDAVQHGERGSREWAALILGHTEDKEVVPYLLPLLKDPEEFVRGNTALALGNIHDPSTREALEQMRDDPSEEVRDAVKIALEDLWPE